VRHAPGLLTGDGAHQPLAEGFAIGMRLHSAPVMRIADARELQIGDVVEADGRWRVLAFADAGGARLSAFLDALAHDPVSPLLRHRRAGDDPDAVIDLRAIYQVPHRTLSPADLPPVLLPCKGRFGLVDYEKAFCAIPGPDRDIYALRGIDRAQGCAVIVRPDQYVSDVLPLDGIGSLARFFARVLI
jgi:phenol 2-monooxygenase